MARTAYTRTQIRQATGWIRPLALRKAARIFLAYDTKGNYDSTRREKGDTFMLGPLPDGSGHSGCRGTWANLCGLPWPPAPSP